jgi:protein TonB
MNQDVLLADFAPGPRRNGARSSTRIIGAGMTLCVYALLALFALLPPVITPQPDPQALKTIVMLLPSPPKTRTERTAPFLAPLIKPHAENIAPPDFTIALAAPPAPAALPAAEPLSTPLLGGKPSGNGASAGSANGTNGNGNAVSGCFDAAWAQAVTDRIGKFFRHPRSSSGRDLTGIVMVDFTVHRGGWVENVEIGKSSGNDRIDRVASEMVRRASPVPRIPDRMHTDQARVELPMNFGVEGATFQPSPNTCE